MTDSGLTACFREHEEGVVLHVRVSPNAAKTKPEGLREDRLALRVKAPPVEGKANKEVLRWAAAAFGLRKSSVCLLRGEHAREKDLLLAGLDREKAEERLKTLIVEE